MTKNQSIRKLDSLGRVLVPVEFRKALGWESGTQVCLTLADDGVLIRRAAFVCAVCGSADDVAQIGEVSLCGACRALLKTRVN